MNLRALLQLRREDKEKDRAGLLSEYVSIVQRHRSPKTGDAERMLTLLDALGFAESRLDQDIAIIDELTRLAREVARRPEIEKSLQAATDKNAKAGAALEAAEIAHREAVQEAEVARHASSQAAKTAEKFRKLAEQHPELAKGVTG